MNNNIAMLASKLPKLQNFETDLRKDKLITFPNVIRQNSTIFSISTNNSYNNNYEFIINDKNIGSINGFYVMLTLPEIKGPGKLGYSKYFGYKLIEEFKIQLDDKDIFKTSCFEMLEKLYDVPKEQRDIIMENAGEIEELRNIKEGFRIYDIIFPERTIYVYVPTPFDSNYRYGYETSISKGEGKIAVSIKISDIKNCFNIIKKSESLLHVQIKNIKLIADIYTQTPKINSFEIENIDYVKYDINDQNIIIPFKNFSRIKWFFTLETNDFIYYPKNMKNEKNWLNNFAKYIAKNALRISDKPIEGMEEVKDNQIFFKNINKSFNIYIDNIPENHSLYFHKKIMMFKCKISERYLNFSEKFNYIYGRYSQSKNKIIFEKIKHDFNMLDVSIPLKKWISDENDDGCDNRLDKYKNTKYRINDLFIGGIDVFGTQSPVKTIIIKIGDKVLYTDNNVTRYTTSFINNKINKLELIHQFPKIYCNLIEPIPDEDMINIKIEIVKDEVPKYYENLISLHLFLYGKIVV